MKYIGYLFVCFITCSVYTQDSICINKTIKHKKFSQKLNENRDYWVSLPLNYSDSLKYSVVYVLDAEWRFDLVRNITFDLGANKKINKSIIIGIPHIDWENKRGVDLTFSESRIEYDGDKVDSTWYNSSNSGGGQKFYEYLINELIPDVNKNYATNGYESLIGHSYGGYFGGYILSKDHPFEAIHMYDPSIWYSNGEVIKSFKENQKTTNKVKIHLTYQPTPEFHRKKIIELIEVLEMSQNVNLKTKLYTEETHNSLYLDSFYSGIKWTNK